MQHGDLDKTKVLKTLRDFKSDVRKPNSKSVLNSVLSVKPVLHTDQTGWTYPIASLVHWTCPIPLPDSRDIFRTCPALDQTCPVNHRPLEFELHRTCPTLSRHVRVLT
jgi:hypothetical protein